MDYVWIAVRQTGIAMISVLTVRSVFRTATQLPLPKATLLNVSDKKMLLASASAWRPQIAKIRGTLALILMLV